MITVGNSRSEELLCGIPYIKAESGAVINCPAAAVVIGRGAEAEIVSALAVIVDGDSDFEIRIEIPRGVQLIACGLSQKNTVSVSSRTEEKITLSLNRAVRGEYQLTEPLELPHEIKALPNGISEFDIMAAFAAELLFKQ